jgi:hypothetical protein
MSVERLRSLLSQILNLIGRFQSGRELSLKINERIKCEMGCSIPFDVTKILEEVPDGEKVDAHVDFGLCPWKHCSGKTDAGDTAGLNTSLLGKFYHRLDHSILTSTFLTISNCIDLVGDFQLPKKKAMVFLDCQWYCRQVYPGVKIKDDSKTFGCTDPPSSANLMPDAGDARKLEVLSAIQLAVLKGAGLQVSSVRGMGDVVEEALCMKEVLNLDSAVNQAPSASTIITSVVEPDCAFFVTPHPARLYRQFKRVYHSYLYLVY